MKNFILGYFSINLALVAMVCGYAFLALHGGIGMLALTVVAGFASSILWQAMDAPEPEPVGSIRGPE
jgi:hypothetical protein